MVRRFGGATTGDPVCNGPFCSSISLCAAPGGAPLTAVIAPTAVNVERSGSTIVIRDAGTDATFRMNLQLANGTLTGTASGQFRSGGIPVQIDGGSPGVEAAVTGTVRNDSVAGRLSGAITVNGAGCSNNGHSWTLTRQ